MAKVLLNRTEQVLMKKCAAVNGGTSMENRKQNADTDREELLDESLSAKAGDADTEMEDRENPADGESADASEENSNPLLKLTIDDLDLSVRAYNSLRRSGFQTVQDIVEGIHSIEDFYRFPYMGRRSSEEICTKLAGYGFRLAPDKGFVFKAKEAVKNITLDNYETYYAMHRRDFNHKLKIHQESFEQRGMTLSSIGFTELYEQKNGDVRARLIYHITFSDAYDFSCARLGISAVARDAESFVISQTRERVQSAELTLSANAIDEAAVIEVSAIGAPPPKKRASQEFTRSKACGVDFDIDFGSFERLRMKLSAYGFRQEKNGGKCDSIVMAEVNPLEPGGVEDLPAMRLCAVLCQGSAIVEMGSTEIVDFSGRFKGNMARIAVESSGDLAVSGIKLYMEAK